MRYLILGEWGVGVGSPLEPSHHFFVFDGKGHYLTSDQTGCLDVTSLEGGRRRRGGGRGGGEEGREGRGGEEGRRGGEEGREEG